MLQVLAEVLTSSVRGSDLVCRTGGDEFILLLSGAPLAVAAERAERVRAEFAARPVDLGDGAVFRGTLSIGVAILRAGGESFESTLHRADMALYEAKRGGRNRTVSAEVPPLA